MKYIHFYATASDIQPVLHRLENDEPLKFIPSGMRGEINRPIYLTHTEIPQPGIATGPSTIACISYMVTPQNIKNVMYSFVDTSGQKRWLLSNGDNPDSVMLNVAGLWRTGTLLPGNMTTLHDTPNAQRIMKRFFSAIKSERFVKHNVFWFGREAMDMLRSGRRLVQAEQSPASFDVPHPSTW